MARTPTFGLISRSLRLARRSLTTGQSASEIVERDSELRAIARGSEQNALSPPNERSASPRIKELSPLSRREFIATSGSAAAAVAIGACVPTLRRGSRRTRPVVIVGAGIAGLTTAYRLRQGGVPVRVYEAQRRVGGRMYSLRDFFPDGQVCELGGELIDSPHATIRQLAAELGITLDDLATDDSSLRHDVWFFGGRARTEVEIVSEFRPIAARISRDLATIRGDGSVTYRSPNGAEPLDRISIAEWLDRAGVSGWIRDLLDVGYTTEYGMEIARQSALNLLLLIEPEPDPFHIYGESDERFHVRGGNDLITQALARRLEDAIETDTRLEAVTASRDGSFTCSMRRGESSFDVLADELVLAIPFTLLRQVRLEADLPPVKRRAIAELGYGTNAKLIVGFSDRIWRRTHRSNGSSLSDLPSQLTWETSRLQPGRSGILTNFVGGAHGLEIGQGTAAHQAALLVADLERIFPGISATRAGMKEARFHWPSFPWTLGSYAGYLTGQWTGICGSEGESIGRLHFAGEHCSLEAQGFMEGGCETGTQVARAMLAGGGVRRAAMRHGPQRQAQMARASAGPSRLRYTA